MRSVYNFSAGPSMLPLPVLFRSAGEMIDYEKTGMSITEISHRSQTFDRIINEARETLRRIMKIPKNYEILFLQGGATAQFAAVPLNLMKTGKADYIVSGEFSQKAYEEGKKYGDVKVVATSKDTNFDRVPDVSQEDIRPEADYVHICLNNTVYGTQFAKIPHVGGAALVCDMSSCILSRPMDISPFGVVYAGAQKNMGIAGLTVVIAREDLLDFARKETPSVFHYRTAAEKQSLYNTPPCYAIYMAGQVFRWIEAQGGLEEIYEVNKKKAQMLYKVIEESKLFTLHAKKEYRSLTNVTFRTADPVLDEKFIFAAGQRGLVSLAGHRKLGGMRASLYNAMPLCGVEKLCAFIHEFDEKGGEI